VDEEGHTVIAHSGGRVGCYSVIRADLDDGLGIVALLNGPEELNRIGRSALRLVRDVCHDRSLPPVSPVVEPTYVENASDYLSILGQGGPLPGMTLVKLQVRNGQTIYARQGYGVDSMETSFTGFFASQTRTLVPVMTIMGAR
jgi:hypothetical protein